MDAAQATTQVQEIKFAWDVIIVGATALVWLIRLESKVIYQTKDQEKLEKDILKLEDKTAKSFSSMGERFDTVKTTLNDMSKSLAKIEGYIDHMKEHHGAD